MYGIPTIPALPCVSKIQRALLFGMWLSTRNRAWASWGHLSHDIVLDGVSVVPSAGERMSTNTDATHFSSCYGKLTLQNCIFEGHGDDAVNVHNYDHAFVPLDGNCYRLTCLATDGTHMQAVDLPSVGVHLLRTGGKGNHSGVAGDSKRRKELYERYLLRSAQRELGHEGNQDEQGTTKFCKEPVLPYQEHRRRKTRFHKRRLREYRGQRYTRYLRLRLKCAEKFPVKYNGNYDGMHPQGWALFADGHKYQGQPVLFTEFGGIAFVSEQKGEAWGYGNGAKDEDDLCERFEQLIKGIAQTEFQGYCYTQLTDVQQEINGLLYADRTPKADLEKLKRIFENK